MKPVKIPHKLSAEKWKQVHICTGPLEETSRHRRYNRPTKVKKRKMTSLEQEHQNKLDRIARLDEETFICDSCETELALVQQCDHDPRLVHNWCINCCSNQALEEQNPIEWNDLE